LPLGVETPNFSKSSLAWYSWIFMGDRLKERRRH
jgi:hypothetical protein